MNKRIFFLFLLIFSILLFTSSVSAEVPEERDNFGTETSTEVSVPLIGWYFIPLFGAMRRHRHELNNRTYSSTNDQF